MPLHAAVDLAALRTPPARRIGNRGAIVIAALAAAFLLGLGASTTLGATTVTPKCDATNLRTGASTSYAKKTAVNTGAKLTVVATVSGGSWSATCAGKALKGSSWYRVSAINGKSVKTLYGVTYLYGASGLFKTVVLPTASPVRTPTPTVRPAATAPPTAPPTAAPATAPPAPTADPGATLDPAATPDPATPAPPPAPVPLPAGVTALPSSVTIYGRGWGHGVGLSQYGAKGRATDGQTAAEILAHYYTGTVLGSMANSQVRVLVLEDFAASAADPAQVYGRGGTWTIDGVTGTFPADARLSYTPTTTAGATTWAVTVTSTDGSTLYSGAAASSIRIRPGTGTTLQLWSTSSAYDRFRGVLRLIGSTGATASVDVVNELPMESYLLGVVPSEMPSSWPAEAIKSQAVAARSYAEYRLHPTSGTFDVYDDTRSQVYLGVLNEKATSTAAIQATAGVVLRTSSGAKVTALFHSADGGWTENNENVFTSSTGAKTAGVYSYLRGSSDRRPDGTSYDSQSPYATWQTRTYTLAQLQAWFGADSRSNVGTLIGLDLRDRGVSGRLVSVTLYGADGSTKKVSGAVFESIFNAHRPSGDPSMRSTLFGLAPIP